MVDFKFKKPQSKEERESEYKDKYFQLLRSHNIEITPNIQEAIDYLISTFMGCLTFSFGKYKDHSVLLVAIKDKEYIEWYCENVIITRDCCIDIVQKVYNILYN